ncbi:glycosyltransferase [Mesonia ostreae]|uniref:Glycosyltransferase n=1 Tax=Mesonia ostreae TaxID=861110 RepID=A0ABU2KEA1_9FLAO|nr:glycosyltransferase [Mesonia ostreae]MDT0293030.1 glycosyltransferase [Mesonia ostreae]
MKIGFVCHDAFPIAQPFQGGLEMITYLLVEELVCRGHEVVSLCLEGSELAGEMIFYTKNELPHDFDSQELNSLKCISYSLNNFLLQDFDVVQNHSLHYQSILMGNISAHNFITTFHTPVFPYLKLAIEAVSANINQTFVGVSKCTANLYQKTLPLVHTVYNGIDVNQWNYNYNSTENYYSWSGRICKEKGLAQLMELCLLENINLKFAGPISEPSYFKEKVEPNLKYDNFEYVGHLKQPQLNDLIGKSKAFMFSSVWDEPYGLVIAEALASGVPVLANNVGAAPEILNADTGCLFNLQKPETFRKCIETIQHISRKDCRMRAEIFCCHKRMVDDYEKLYKRNSESFLVKAI